MKRLIFVTVAALAGCGGGGSGPATSPPGLASLMATADCRGTVHTDELFVREATDCMMGGQQVSAATFATKADRDKWVTMLRTTGYPVETGDLWAVSGTDRVAVDAFAAASR